MLNLPSILVLLGLLVVVFFIIHLMLSAILDLLSVLDIPSISNETWWDNNVTVVEDLIQDKFPIAAERIFTGKYISHWEIPRFELMSSVNCQLDIPFEGGWDWLVEGLNNPTTRSDYSGTFNISFRGKMLESGCFGHMCTCSHRIEVIEILSVMPIIPN
jgi:hypothetical protein